MLLFFVFVFVLCACVCFFSVVVKHIHSGILVKVTSAKFCISVLFLYCFFYLNKTKLTMALHCKCEMSLKALLVSKVGVHNHVYLYGDIHN